jgi:hypothetical protein
MRNRGIAYVWTYLDTGTSGKYTLNQISHEEFTLANKLKELEKAGLKEKIMSFSRYLFLFHSSERYAVAYRRFSGVIRKKSIGMFFRHLYSIVLVLIRYLNVRLFWDRIKDKPSETAKFTPLFFNLPEGKGVKGFQTLEVTDFRETFSDDNLKRFVSEAGVCIAHTYFAVLLPHHKGRVFVDASGALNDGTEEAFENLGALIESKKIWNPTLKELGEYFELFTELEFTFDGDGNIVPAKEYKEIHFRLICGQ